MSGTIYPPGYRPDYDQAADEWIADQRRMGQPTTMTRDEVAAMLRSLDETQRRRERAPEQAQAAAQAFIDRMPRGEWMAGPRWRQGAPYGPQELAEAFTRLTGSNAVECNYETGDARRWRKR